MRVGYLKVINPLAVLEAREFARNGEAKCRPPPLEPFALLYVATVVARRPDGAKRTLIELKRQVQTGEPPGVIGKTVETMEKLLGASGARPDHPPS